MPTATVSELRNENEELQIRLDEVEFCLREAREDLQSEERLTERLRDDLNEVKAFARETTDRMLDNLGQANSDWRFS